MMKGRQMERQETMKRGCILAAVAALALLSWSAGTLADSLRNSTMGNVFIAQIDEDSQLNPYDYGRNPGYLFYDFAGNWNRFSANVTHETGTLKRPLDPRTIDDLFGQFAGRKQLGSRQVVWGQFRYDRFEQRDLFRSLELDPYNDPFFLTDTTSGNTTYYGPSIRVDYSLRLSSKVSFGAGLDYDISTGLKDYYTRPQIVHNYFKGNFGLIMQPTPKWILGLIARPIRLQNRTEFDKTDEGFDNLIKRYAGDEIYEIRTFESYTIRELLWGVEFDMQNFYVTDRVKVGTILTYGLSQNKIKYNVSFPEEIGFWQDRSYGLKFLARYTPAGSPLVLGLSGEASNGEGWAKRPRFDNVLLFDNPIKLRSIGAGASYAFNSLGLVLTGEYVLNGYKIEADDFGANEFPKVDITQNIGRLGAEYRAFNVYSIRAGVEVTDYPIDRWLKLPANMTRYRFTGGLGYNLHFWSIEAEFGYETSVRDGLDGERRDLSGILWFTRSEE
jgi:hypothetical protein